MCRPLSVEYPALPEDALSFAVAVGQDEESLPLVRCADLGRSKQTPLRIEPEGGKVFENGVESQPKVSWDILKEHERRSRFLDDPRNVGPQVALVQFPELLPGDREGLARVSRAYEIDSATPRTSAEGTQVRPDRSPIQGRVFHPGHETGRGIGFPLDVANTTAPLAQADVDATDSGADREGSEPGT